MNFEFNLYIYSEIKSFKIFSRRENKGNSPSSRQDSRRSIRDRNRNLDLFVIKESLNMTENSQSSLSGTAISASFIDKTDKIFNALRLVPEFDGNSNVLIRFLNICDQIVLAYVDPAPGNELNNYAVINGILNKITGPAARTLATNGTPSDWKGIRSALINSFSDHRDESSLYSDLSMLSQGNDTPHIFYERIQNLLGTIMTYVELHDDITTTVEAKRTLYKKLALQSYLKGLREPLGSRVRCMRPPTLEKALEFAQEELNIIYMQNSQKVTQRSPTFKNINFNPFLNRQISQQSHTNNSQILPHLNNTSYQGPSRTQQIFRALPRSNMSTGFRIPNRETRTTQHQHQVSNQTPGQPMSGISHPKARTLPPTPMRPNHWSRQGQYHSPNYYKEINTNEYDTCNDVNYYDTFMDNHELNYDTPCNVDDHLVANSHTNNGNYVNDIDEQTDENFCLAQVSSVPR